MKKTDLVKFSLTLISAAVLAACSSGGSKSTKYVEPSADPNNSALTSEEPEKKEEDVKTPKDDKVEGTQSGIQNITENTETGLSYGHQFAKKTESKLLVGGDSGINSDSSSSTNASANRALHFSLDSIVVATSRVDNKLNAIYLEDFDFRGNTANTTGSHTLEHIHVVAAEVDPNDTTGRLRVVAGTDHTFALGNNGQNSLVTPRPGAVGNSRSVGITKTNVMGAAPNYVDGTEVQSRSRGQAIVFTNRDFYIPSDAQGIDQSLGGANRIQRFGTVAEVYGNRTFVRGDSATAQANNLAASQQLSINNAPYLTVNSAANNTFGHGRLDYVQYGRVTSALSNIDNNRIERLNARGQHIDENGNVYTLNQDNAPQLRTGLDFGSNSTVGIAAYGLYGVKGTEDVYFYRSNVQSRDQLNIDRLVDRYKGANIVYNGHAVTYGLDHSNRLTYGAISNSPEVSGGLLSGTHAQAKVNLETREVTGKLYDVWTVSGRNVPNNLVEFQGKLNAANGSIVGKSNLAYGNKSSGDFHANLFGPNIEEMGGSLRSDNTKSGQNWGAVFGAKSSRDVGALSATSDGDKTAAQGNN